MPDSPWVEPARSEDPKRQLAELANLYEVARALIGARDQRQIAARIVLSGMGTLGLRSGAMFVVDDKGRFRLLAAAGVSDHDPGESLQIPSPVREWMLREEVFALATPGAARGLGPLRDRLVERFDAAIAGAISDRSGLLALLAYGPKLLGGEFDPHDVGLLESFLSLAGRALTAGLPLDLRGSVARPRSRAKPARSLEALRITYPPLSAMIGESPALLETCQDLLAVAGTRFPVLLHGESGVGKELAARAIHELSARDEGPFEVVDCGSIPRELIESELFGHVRGSFTGAHRDRRGAFEMAHRGTLFLDEIGEMPLQLQTRLLRVLQEGRIRKVGDERPISVDVRVIAATNRDLRAEVTAKRFREDLFYRLNVFSVRLAPLRERVGDIQVLVRHFLGTQGTELGVAEWVVEADVVESLETYHWPGNIRELANLAAALTVRTRNDGHIALDDLNLVWRRQHGGEDPPWLGRAEAPRGQLGAWVLEQARASRFNLIEAARSLQRRKRQGQQVPLTERSALAYYLNGEILRALVEARGDAAVAARTLAGDEHLESRLLPRVRKISEMLAEARANGGSLKRQFAKLPADYDEVLEQAGRLLETA